MVSRCFRKSTSRWPLNKTDLRVQRKRKQQRVAKTFHPTQSDSGAKKACPHLCAGSQKSRSRSRLPCDRISSGMSKPIRVTCTKVS